MTPSIQMIQPSNRFWDMLFQPSTSVRMYRFALKIPLHLMQELDGIVCLWSTTATTQTIRVNAVGMYHVGVFENGCESRDTVILSHHPAAPSVDIGPADTTICSNDSLILDATTAGVTYQWQNSTTNPTQTVKNGWDILGHH